MKHKHADVIHAWADGAEIQWRLGSFEEWRDLGSNPPASPAFNVKYEYRVKPKVEFHTVESFVFYEPKNGGLTVRTASAYPPNLRMTFDHTGRLVGVDLYGRG